MFGGLFGSLGNIGGGFGGGSVSRPEKKANPPKRSEDKSIFASLKAANNAISQ